MKYLKNSAIKKLKKSCQNQILWLNKSKWQVPGQVGQVNHCPFDEIFEFGVFLFKRGDFSKWGRMHMWKSSWFWKEIRVWVSSISVLRCCHFPTLVTTYSNSLPPLSKLVHPWEVHPLSCFGFLFKYATSLHSSQMIWALNLCSCDM